MRRKLALVLLGILVSGVLFAYRAEYEIEVSHNDELFIINGARFQAKTFCLGMEEGDRVIFLEGSALGACASAEILNLRTNKNL